MNPLFSRLIGGKEKQENNNSVKIEICIERTYNSRKEIGKEIKAWASC